MRNRLAGLLRFDPATPRVHATPLLIVPAWIMKYYILDLSAHNSLVRYLVEHGHTVYVISWENPAADDRDLGLDDYRRHGIMASLDAITRDTGGGQVNACGAPVSFLEAGMWSQGYLDTRHMAGNFQMLRSNDLIWSRRLRHCLLDLPDEQADLMSWNADATRMPFRMHSKYLRRLLLKNDLASARYRVDGKPVALTGITAPIFAVGTRTDHVAPWRSAYKIALLTDTEVSFLLPTGGHDAGVVAPPGGRGGATR